jgi:hypothetical protein
VADREQENAREHLTEREREALKILAREIVREAVQQQITEQKQEQAWIEGEKLEHDTAKTQVLITAGLLGASGAAWFIPDPKHVWLLGFAVVLGITELGFTLNYMSLIANDVRRPSDIATFRRWPRDSSLLLSATTFVVATFLLSAYLIYNI